MGFFKKRDEVLDLTLLQKKGILKKIQNSNIEEVEDVLDLSQNQTSSNMMNSSSFNSQMPPQSSPFDLLDIVVQTNSNQSQDIQSRIQNADDLQDLKVKLDNLEYKIESLLKIFEKIEERLPS